MRVPIAAAAAGGLLLMAACGSQPALKPEHLIGKWKQADGINTVNTRCGVEFTPDGNMISDRGPPSRWQIVDGHLIVDGMVSYVERVSITEMAIGRDAGDAVRLQRC